MSHRRQRTKNTDSTPAGRTAGPSSGAATGSPAQSVLNIKVVRTADATATLERLQRVAGFRAIEPLFPGETQADLASIYVAHVDTERLVTALPEIEADDDVEYVEKAAARKLIR